jgi:hypothetical protein
LLSSFRAGRANFHAGDEQLNDPGLFRREQLGPDFGEAVQVLPELPPSQAFDVRLAARHVVTTISGDCTISLIWWTTAASISVAGIRRIGLLPGIPDRIALVAT